MILKENTQKSCFRNYSRIQVIISLILWKTERTIMHIGWRICLRSLILTFRVVIILMQLDFNQVEIIQQPLIRLRLELLVTFTNIHLVAVLWLETPPDNTLTEIIHPSSSFKKSLYNILKTSFPSHHDSTKNMCPSKPHPDRMLPSPFQSMDNQNKWKKKILVHFLSSKTAWVKLA